MPTRLPVRVDFVIFAVRDASLQVLLWRRDDAPHRGAWTLPGGFVEKDEGPEAAALRVLSKKTGLARSHMEQLFTFGVIDEDPRGPFLSVAYFVVVAAEAASPDGTWHPARAAPELPFHHDRVLAKGIERLRTKSEYSTVPFRFLEDAFTLSDVQAVYEVLLDRELDKRNFRRKVLALEALEELPGRRRSGAHRPARLFRLAPQHPYLLKERGILFPF